LITFNNIHIPYDNPFVDLISDPYPLIFDIFIEIPPPYLLIKAESLIVL
jgi:hypothetical protein